MKSRWPISKRTRAPFVASRSMGGFERFLEWVDGRKFTLDGVEGIIHVEEVPRGSYYGGGLELRVWHEATAKGRKSASYRKVRAELHDDYDTDLTHSERLVTEIAAKLGWKE